MRIDDFRKMFHQQVVDQKARSLEEKVFSSFLSTYFPVNDGRDGRRVRLKGGHSVLLHHFDQSRFGIAGRGSGEFLAGVGSPSDPKLLSLGAEAKIFSVTGSFIAIKNPSRYPSNLIVEPLALQKDDLFFSPVASMVPLLPN